MADIIVSVSMGVMNPLLEKLAMLMGDEYKKFKGLQEEVSFLKHELSDMKALLENMDNADKLNPQDKAWRKDIIDMSYDIENYIDDFMSRVGEADDNVGILQKASQLWRTFKDRHHQADQFKKIKNRVIEVCERRKRYKLDQCISSSSTNRGNVDPRLPALYQNSASLVGIDNQKEEIVRWVMDDEGQQLKVMSIVGLGGLGKTTLAKEVYREVGRKLKYKAFVSISQNPDIIKLLNKFMEELGVPGVPNSQACEPKALIDNIEKHLWKLRYFIIVDDLWDKQAWDTISCAFPQNNHHSRVMITTRNEDVARGCCGNHGFIHNMKPLGEQDSRKLFLDRIFEPEDANYAEVLCKILKKCGGLPLAIITMASMIACQPNTPSKWRRAESILNSLGAELFATNKSYEVMMDIIDLSYKNLPHHLKACFLCLGTYPEDYKISRVELVRRWVAEGFVSCSSRQDAWDVAESYFSELVNRSMIQQEYDDYDDIGIEVTHCTVHDMILELIVRKCREDNFISLINTPEMMSEGQDKVIRLTIDSRGVKDGIKVTTNNICMRLLQVRSLNIFGGKECQIPNLEKLKFMRLLFLAVDDLKTDIDLTCINHLSHLRYLRVGGRLDKDKVLLPPQIQGLQFLETLDLSSLYPAQIKDGLKIIHLPEIVDVPRLSHLSVPTLAGGGRLPDGIGKVKSLLSLTGFSLAMNSLQSITGLGELTALSELILVDWTMVIVPLPMITSLIAALITSLGNLGNLRTLVLWSLNNDAYCGDAMLKSSFSPPFRKIEHLDLRVLIFSRVPRWIGHLCYLRELLIRPKQIHQEDLDIIGTRLTSLVRLELWVVHIPTESIVIGGSTGFNVLKIFTFTFNCNGASWLTFEAGAMPDLQELDLKIDPNGWNEATPVGLQHLPSLKRILVNPVYPYDAEITPGERTTAMLLMLGVFEKAANALPTSPEVDVQRRSREGRR